MPCFVVFLRAINVGGHVVMKATLQEAFVALGFRNVTTYKQTGNIIFESPVADPEIIKVQVREKLRVVLGYEVGVFVCTTARLKQIVESEPFKGKAEEGVSFLVTFLEKSRVKFPLKLPVMIPNSTAEIFSASGSEVFSIARGHGDGGKPNPFIESKLKMQATTRNWNVISEIVRRNNESNNSQC